MPTNKTHNKESKKYTNIGKSPLTKRKQPGPNGGNKGYKKLCRGEGKWNDDPPLYLEWGLYV